MICQDVKYIFYHRKSFGSLGAVIAIKIIQLHSFEKNKLTLDEDQIIKYTF